MESTVLVLYATKMAIASSLGVMFGWQPMPDAASNEDGPKIEYIIQIEPELVATLQAGQSIPITSDIPADIGPIGRIRVVIGRDELPRQKLVTNFKPWPTKQPTAGQLREGLVETQFTVPPVQSSNSGRYGSQATANNSILPPSGGAPGGSATATTNPFGRALQQGAEQARNLATDVKQQILPPSSNELFGGSGAGQGVQNAINNTNNQFRRGLQQGVEQVADRAGQQLRQAVDNVGQDARNASDRFGRSLLPEQSTLDDRQGQPAATILPPSAQSTSLPGKGRRIDKPIQPQYQQPQRQQPILGAPPASFAESSPARTNPSSQPGVFDAPWPSTSGSPPAATTVGNTPPPSRYGNQASQPPAQAPSWPTDPSGRDSFDLASLPSQNAAPIYAEDNQSGFSTTGGSTKGPSFPASGSQPTTQHPAVQQPFSSQHNGNTNWSGQSPTPEIRAPVQTQPDAAGMQPVGDTRGYQQSDNKNLFPLLLSWVLLSGSGAGNLYLFWSYLDVRNKYRSVVHSAPRRRDRYDD